MNLFWLFYYPFWFFKLGRKLISLKCNGAWGRGRRGIIPPPIHNGGWGRRGSFPMFVLYRNTRKLLKKWGKQFHNNNFQNLMIFFCEEKSSSVKKEHLYLVILFFSRGLHESTILLFIHLYIYICPSNYYTSPFPNTKLFISII